MESGSGTKIATSFLQRLAGAPYPGDSWSDKNDPRHTVRRPSIVALLVRARMVINPVLSRILIVDDNADLAEATSMMLGICGFDTRTAYCGRLAMEQARSFQPEIVLLDIGLPDIDGYQVAATLRGEDSLSAATFIAVSAVDPDSQSPFAREARFDHYLIKPVDFDVLIRLLTKDGL